MDKITDIIKANSRELEKELHWFRQVLDTRLKLYFGQESVHGDIYEIKPPVIEESDSNWAKLIQEYQPDFAERITLLLALVPHIDPRLLDVFFIKNAQYDRSFSEFGGASKSGA